tara:strand:+ start:1309 stop:1572 length:264 start_codon:yes stop_codon:yes gene_type:complete
MSKALTIYAHSAFPKGGSECSQVVRESLLDSANLLSDNLENEFIFTISKRHKELVKAGLKWYFGNDGPGNLDEAYEILEKFNVKKMK